MFFWYHPNLLRVNHIVKWFLTSIFSYVCSASDIVVCDITASIETQDIYVKSWEIELFGSLSKKYLKSCHFSQENEKNNISAFRFQLIKFQSIFYIRFLPVNSNFFEHIGDDYPPMCWLEVKWITVSRNEHPYLSHHPH